MRLDGKRSLVTGGGSGIGTAIVRAFAAEGSRVAVLDLDAAAADRVAAELAGALPIGCDVTDSAAVDAAVNRTVDHLGGLDILVNNAGIGGRPEMARILPRLEAQVAEMAAGRIPRSGRRLTYQMRSGGSCSPLIWTARSTAPGRRCG